MEITEDSKNQIALYLDNEISTLVSKKIRDLYFRKNCIVIHDTCYLSNNQKSNILRNYRIKIKQYRPLKEFSFLLISEEIRGNIIEVALTYPRSSHKHTRLDLLDNVEKLKLCIKIEDIGKIKGNHLAKTKNIIIIITGPFMTFQSESIDYFVKFLETYDIKLSLEMTRLLAIESHVSLKMTECLAEEYIRKITDRVINLYTEFPIKNDFPNLEKLSINPKQLLNNTRDFTKLRKIDWTRVSRQILNSRLYKYRNVKKVFKSCCETKLWIGIDFQSYANMRNYIYKSDIDSPRIEDLPILMDLERNYRDVYPNGKKMIICPPDYEIPEDLVTEYNELFDHLDC